MTNQPETGLKLGAYAASLNLTSLDFHGNFDRATALLRQIALDVREKSFDVGIVAFPDLTFTGPGCGDAFLRPATLKKAMETLLAFEAALASESRLIAIVGVPIAYRGAVYKSSAAIVGGKLRGFVCATSGDLSPRDDLRQFSPWPAGEAKSIQIGARKFPIGDLVFVEGPLALKRYSTSRLVREGGEVLDPFYELGARLDAAALYGDKSEAGEAALESVEAAEPVVFIDGERSEGALDASRKIVVKFSADVAPFALGRRDRTLQALKKASARDSSLILSPSVVGVESGAKVYDGGAAVAFCGEAIGDRRFSYAESRVLSFAFSAEAGADGRLRATPIETCGSADEEAWGVGDAKRFEEFARAVPLALFDYMRKTRSKGFALSLSGGADSATIAALVRLGVPFGVRERGFRFLNWLSRGESLDDVLKAFPALRPIFESREDWARDFSKEGAVLDKRAREELERAIVGALLTTFYQSTRNSGEVTREAAREVAKACGATYYEFDVDSVVESYKEMIAKSTGRPWSWESDDLALQNIQARSRGPSGWLLANRDGRTLLATGNRSECACGYATMDGDTCGGLSPIAGIDKAFIRKWLRWMETVGVSDEEGGRFPIPALRYINAQSPTAELRPAEARQTDESDLMPYVVLNLFERALIRDRLPIRDAFARVVAEARAEGIDATDETFIQWGRKFCRLWDASQWKRQRYAPGFSLDDYDLFPSSWTQYPYLSSGFRAELDDLT